MNQIIAPKAINFNELVKNSNTTLSLNLETKMINILNTKFTEEEQQWYIANLYIYMNYHPTNDYPINLENVFKMIGFANKGNAMKTIKSNFTLDEDYKLLIIPREKKQNVGRSEHEIMLNVDNKKVYYFKGSDIGKALHLTNIHSTIQNYEDEDKDERVIRKAYDPQMNIQNTTFLSSQGVYRLLLINLNAFYFKNLFKDKLFIYKYINILQH
jgi:uncharacterized protein YneR